MKISEVSFTHPKSLYEYIWSNSSIVRIYFDYDGNTKYATKEEFEASGDNYAEYIPECVA